MGPCGHKRPHCRGGLGKWGCEKCPLCQGQGCVSSFRHNGVGMEQAGETQNPSPKVTWRALAGVAPVLLMPC